MGMDPGILFNTHYLIQSLMCLLLKVLLHLPGDEATIASTCQLLQALGMPAWLTGFILTIIYQTSIQECNYDQVSGYYAALL